MVFSFYSVCSTTACRFWTRAISVFCTFWYLALLKLGHIWYQNDQRDAIHRLVYEFWRSHAKCVFVYISENVKALNEMTEIRFSTSPRRGATSVHCGARLEGSFIGHNIFLVLYG